MENSSLKNIHLPLLIEIAKSGNPSKEFLQALERCKFSQYEVKYLIVLRIEETEEENAFLRREKRRLEKRIEELSQKDIIDYIR